MEENLDLWPTIPEAVQRTGISQRTLERRIADGIIRTQKRPIPNRKPLVVLHPEDVESLTRQTLRPIVETRQSDILPVRQHDKVPPRQPDMAVLLKALTEPRVNLSEKVYLTVKEAAALLGLPQTHVRAQVKSGSIPAIKLAGWRIRRNDVLAYHPAIVELAESPRKPVQNKESSILPSNGTVA